MTDQPVPAALYARVSTGRQAEADLSIPDQTRHAQDFCARRGFVLLQTFVEPGASGMDEDRPAFQRMIDRATGPDRPFRVILVHSLSRFFRDAMFAEFYTRRLRNAGVQLRHPLKKSHEKISSILPMHAVSGHVRENLLTHVNERAVTDRRASSLYYS